MKKCLMAAVALICMTMTLATFSSCNKSDDDNSGGNGGGTSSSDKWQMKIDLKVSKDAMDVADFTVTYTDADGKDKTEQFTDTAFVKYFTSKVSVDTVRYAVTYKMKDSIPADKAKFTFLKYDATSIGKWIGSGWSSLHVSSSISSGTCSQQSKIPNTLTRIYGKWSNKVAISK